MIEITHYIEDLLLHNDCVIVPGLGGFIAQDCSAYYVEEEEIFLPPYRSVSFNPRLTMNDGLLVHEVARQTGFTYEEAWITVQQEVENICKAIESEGQFTIHGVGVLQLSEGATYDFVPLLCGIAAPCLYGLDCFYATSITEEEEEEPIAENLMQEEASAPRHARLTLIRYAAVAIVAAVFSALCLLPIHKPIPSTIKEANVLQSVINLFAPLQQEVTPETAQPEVYNQQAAPICTAEEKAQNVDTMVAQTQEPKQEIVDIKEEKRSAAEPAEEASAKTADIATEKLKAKKQEATTKKKKSVGPYTIVLSSAVPSNGARVMVRDMKRNGYSDARVFNDKRMVRVIYGNFSSQNAAKAALRNIRRPDNVFAQAWVYKIPES